MQLYIFQVRQVGYYFILNVDNEESQCQLCSGIQILQHLHNIQHGQTTTETWRCLVQLQVTHSSHFMPPFYIDE